MPVFGRKSTIPPAVDEEILADIADAQARRKEASEQYRDTLTQGFAVTRLASYFAERRKRNGFGESIQITFTPRGSNAA